MTKMTAEYRKETEYRLAYYVFGIGYELCFAGFDGKWMWCYTVKTEAEAEAWIALGK